MIRKAVLALSVLAAVLAASGFVLYARNSPPSVPPLSTADVARTTRPYVVKLHAKWCPVCMMTKDVWTQIAATYGSRVNLVVLDFTTDANTEASRVEAARLGLTKMFDEYGGATGMVVVVDGRTREVNSAIKGSRDFAEYRAAIDAALASVK